MPILESLVDKSTEFFLEQGIWGLIAISFAESSFFLIPPDVVLIPLSILNPGQALFYAFVTTIASVLGGIFGYFIGCKAGRPLLNRYASEETLRKIDGMLNRYGGWAVVIAGFTPIPYKIFTIASGVSRIKLQTFIVASLIGRGARFFLEGIIIMLLGTKAAEFLDKYMETGTLLLTAAIGLVYLIVKFLYKPHSKRLNDIYTKGPQG